jgi:hypothetical protein
MPVARLTIGTLRLGVWKPAIAIEGVVERVLARAVHLHIELALEDGGSAAQTLPTDLHSGGKVGLEGTCVFDAHKERAYWRLALICPGSAFHLLTSAGDAFLCGGRFLQNVAGFAVANI